MDKIWESYYRSGKRVVKESFSDDINLLKSLVPGSNVTKGNDGYYEFWEIDPSSISSNSDDYFDRKLSQYESTKDYGTNSTEYYLGDGYIIVVNTTDVYDEAQSWMDGEEFGRTKDGKVCGESFGVFLVTSKAHGYREELVRQTKKRTRRIKESNFGYDETSESDKNMFDAFSTLVASEMGFEDLSTEQEALYNDAIEKLVQVAKMSNKLDHKESLRPVKKRSKRVDEGLTISKVNSTDRQKWDGPNEWNTGNIPSSNWDDYWNCEFVVNLENPLGKTPWDAKDFSQTTFNRFKELVTRYHNGQSMLYDPDDRYINDKVYNVIKDVNSPEEIVFW